MKTETWGRNVESEDVTGGCGLFKNLQTFTIFTQKITEQEINLYHPNLFPKFPISLLHYT